MLSKLLQLLLRKKTPVQFQDMGRIKPVSELFGLDRGMPVDRYYIERFLEKESTRIRGKALEVGDDKYTLRYGGERVSESNVLHVSEQTGQKYLNADLTILESLPAERYDCFICTQTLNFIFDVEKAIQGVDKLLRPGGTLLATVAGISQISRYDMDRWGDYWRFTTASLERLLAPVFTGGLEIESHGNALAACAFLQGCAVEDLPNPTILDDVDPDYQVLLTIVAQKASS